MASRLENVCALFFAHPLRPLLSYQFLKLYTWWSQFFRLGRKLSAKKIPSRGNSSLVLGGDNFALSLPLLSSPLSLFSFCFIQPQFGSMPHVMKFTRLTQQLASPLRPNFCFKVSDLFSSFFQSLISDTSAIFRSFSRSV